VVFGGWIEPDGVIDALAAHCGGNDCAFFAGVVKGDLVPIGREFEIIDLRVFDPGESIERTGGLGLGIMRICPNKGSVPHIDIFLVLRGFCNGKATEVANKRVQLIT
jgi:hypothetical protein